MFRQLFTGLLITGYLASQLAIVPHVHAAGTASPGHVHDGRAHFHAHGHSHVPTQSHDDQNHPEHNSTAPAPDNSHCAVPNGGDPIYLPDVSVTFAKINVSTLFAVLDANSARLGTDEFGRASQLDFSNDSNPGGDLYLILRALRI